MRIGLDPEVAIIHKQTGEGRSAHRFIKKLEQYTFYRDNSTVNGELGAEVERDGAAVEVRSIVPSACRDNIIPYVAEALRQQQLKLDKMWDGEYILSSVPVFTIPKSDLKGAPKDVYEFGCRPDLDGYSLNIKDPQCPKGDMRRFTGGHVHYSTVRARNNIEQQAALAILYDYFVAMPVVAILGEKFGEGEAERRRFYGQPGSFRFDDQLDKIEFRTLSGRVLLHPTLLYWVLGMMKTFYSAVPRSDYMGFLKKTLMIEVDPDIIYNTVVSHDVGEAERLCERVFKLLPTYRKDVGALRNPMSAGGAGTLNPYFYEQAVRVFIEGNHAGMTWPDDMRHNWGLYEDYEPKHHSYWGIQQAMVGLCDDDIFPYNKVLPGVWPNDLIQKVPMYTHPLNGGKKKYVTPGAAGWLR